MEYPKKVRLQPRIEGAEITVKITPPQPLRNPMFISIMQPAPECRSVERQKFDHALVHIGHMRNAFALRGIRLQTRDDAVRVECSGNDLVLLVPATATIDEMTAAFHNYINATMAEIVNSGDLYYEPMLLLDDAFIEMAMRNAKKKELYEFMATLRDAKKARNRLCNSDEPAKMRSDAD